MNMKKEKKTIQEIVQKKYPEFTPGVDGLSVSELETKLSTYAKEQEKVQAAKESDEELEEARSKVTSLAGPYKDANAAIRLKMKYIISLIGDKGGDV